MKSFVIVVLIVAIPAIIIWIQKNKISGPTDLTSRVIRGLKQPHSRAQFKFRTIAMAEPRDAIDLLAVVGLPESGRSALKTALLDLCHLTNDCVVFSEPLDATIWGCNKVITISNDGCPDTDYFIDDEGTIFGWVLRKGKDYQFNSLFNRGLDPSDPIVDGWEKILVIIASEDLMPADPP